MLSYFIAVFLGFITSSIFLVSILIICRVGIPSTIYISKKDDTSNYMKKVLKIQRNRYILTLFVEVFVALAITGLVYFFIYKYFLWYCLVALIVLLFYFKQTGGTPDNMAEFWKHYFNLEKQGLVPKDEN